MSDLRTILSAFAMFLALAAAFVGGVITAVEHPVERCPSYRIHGEQSAQIVLTDRSGGDGVRCVTIRGYFEGDPSQWRYLLLPQ